MISKLCVLISLLVVFQAQADTSEEMAKKVIQLRQEVELLNDQYKNEKELVSNQLKALSVQKAELESNIRNEKVRGKQLREKMIQLKRNLSDNSLESKELTPILEKNIAELRKYIKGSLPFKTNDRLESLNQLEGKLKAKEMTPLKAANHLWSLLEDERRMARETSLHKQTISMGGQLKLASVVKVGMLFLYFKTDDGKVGMAQKVGSDWEFVPFAQEVKQQQTLAFMESLKKQIRQGYFDLPTTL